MNTDLSVLEICAGAGGQSKGLEDAGFGHELAVEIDPDACNTLRLNRPSWKVDERDVHEVDGRAYKGIDLIAGGVPCPPFSIAGKQLGDALVHRDRHHAGLCERLDLQLYFSRTCEG